MLADLPVRQISPLTLKMLILAVRTPKAVRSLPASNMERHTF